MIHGFESMSAFIVLTISKDRGKLELVSEKMNPKTSSDARFTTFPYKKHGRFSS